MYYQKNRWSTAKKYEYKGYRYDSGFEGQYAKELDLRQKAGEIESWERQVKIPLIVNGYLVCDYYIDFVVYYPNGITEYVECKGYAMPVWKLKWKLFEALYSEKPDVRLLVVKQKSNWNMRKIKKVKLTN